MPSDLAKAGNTIYKELKLKCSIRLPPTAKGAKVNELLKKTLEEPSADTFGAKLEYTLVDVVEGCTAADLPVALLNNLHAATKEVFGAESLPVNVGSGSSIPFMDVFKREFPKSNFMITGCGFSDSNAQGPNENLDI
jgi:acetylornithine deacetylase/succinyl-diaminopimelate desuccinylase-like protein